MIVINKFYEVPKDLIAFAPFFLCLSSLSVAFYAGVIVLSLLIVVASILFFIRKLIQARQRLALALIISVSIISIVGLFLNASIYPVADNIGLFLPLLLINSFTLSIGTSIFVMSDFKSVLKKVFRYGAAVLLFFLLIGIIQEILNNLSFFNSAAGAFFIAGFLFALLNYLKKSIASKSVTSIE